MSLQFHFVPLINKLLIKMILFHYKVDIKVYIWVFIGILMTNIGSVEAEVANSCRLRDCLRASWFQL